MDFIIFGSKWSQNFEILVGPFCFLWATSGLNTGVLSDRAQPYADRTLPW